MECSFEVRRGELLAESRVEPGVCQGLLKRLETFVEPFAGLLARREQAAHAVNFVSGLLSDLQRKNTESIAYRQDQDRKDLQHFIGQSPWDHQPLLLELSRQVGQQLGCPDGVLVFDPSAFAKKGTHSVGVQRQWCGRLGESRELPGRNLPGLCFRRGACLGQRASLSPAGVGGGSTAAQVLPRSP